MVQVTVALPCMTRMRLRTYFTFEMHPQIDKLFLDPLSYFLKRVVVQSKLKLLKILKMHGPHFHRMEE